MACSFITHSVFSRHETHISEDTIIKMGEFVCEMHGKTKLSLVSEALLQMFLDTYKSKKGKEWISRAKKIDGSALLPCSKSLLQKIKRAHFDARLGIVRRKQKKVTTKMGLEKVCRWLLWSAVLWGENSPTLDILCCDDELIQYSDREDKQQNVNFWSL